MKRKFEEGMSLVSVLIAAALMGMLAMFMLKMQENQLKTQNDIEARAEINQFLNTLVNTLAKPGYCEMSLQGKKINKDQELSIDKIVAPNGHVVFEVGKKYGNRTLTLKEIRQKDFNKDTDSSGYVTFDVLLEKNKKAFGAKVISRELMVMVQFDEDQSIVDCGTLGAIGNSGGAANGIDMQAIESVTKGLSDKVLEKDSTGAMKLKEEEVRKLINNNDQLRMMQEAIKRIQETNQNFEEQEY